MENSLILSKNGYEWTSRIIQSADESGYNPPQVEEPQRLVATLHCIARGFALVYGRTQLSERDVAMIRPIAYSSMPEDRRLIYQALRSTDMLLTSEIMRLFGCSKPKALKVMTELQALGAVKLREVRSGNYITLV